MYMEKIISGSASLHHQTNTNMKHPVEQMGITKQNESIVLHNESVIHAQDVEKAVTVLNGLIDLSRTNLKFVYHEELHEYYVTVVNPLTNETIKEIPPKKMLDMYASMVEFMGILVDRKI